MQQYSQGEIYGTWYPSGFHGHFRSKSRLEYTVPYREQAKPPPPSKFLDRAQVRSTDHLFSRHDNRNSHTCGMGDLESYFSHGLGKRKVLAGAAQRNKDTSGLLAWSADSPSSGRISSYRSDFSNTAPQWQQQRLMNQTEPVHNRSNLRLHRRQRRPITGMQTDRTAPLLAWNEPNDRTYMKPCIGTHRKALSTSRVLSRPESDTGTRPLQNSVNRIEAGNNCVIETVSRLEL